MWVLIKNKFWSLASCIKNDRGIALLTALALSIILMGLGITYYMKNALEAKLVVQGANQVQSYYGAEAGINWGLLKLTDSNYGMATDWNETVQTPTGVVYVAYRRKDMGGGYLSETRGFLYATTLNPINSAQEHTLVAEVSRVPKVYFAAAALTGPNGGTGNFVIDGRDHKLAVTNEESTGWDSDAALVPNNGTLAIVTDAGFFNRSGNMTIGGTQQDTNQDVTPTKVYAGPNGWNTVVELTNTNLASTPDEVMEFNEGYMKTFAQNHGTYYLNPADGLTLTCDDGQIYYLEFTGNHDVTFQNLVLNMSSPAKTAIVVVHHANPNYTVTMKNMTGTFKGILIVDQVDKIHGTIVGALHTLGGAANMGNGSGGIYYSEAVAGRMIANHGSAMKEEATKIKTDIIRWKEDNTKDVYRNIGISHSWT